MATKTNLCGGSPKLPASNPELLLRKITDKSCILGWRLYSETAVFSLSNSREEVFSSHTRTLFCFKGIIHKLEVLLKRDPSGVEGSASTWWFHRATFCRRRELTCGNLHAVVCWMARGGSWTSYRSPAGSQLVLQGLGRPPDLQPGSQSTSISPCRTPCLLWRAASVAAWSSLARWRKKQHWQCHYVGHRKVLLYSCCWSIVSSLFSL